MQNAEVETPSLQTWYWVQPRTEIPHTVSILHPSPLPVSLITDYFLLDSTAEGGILVALTRLPILIYPHYIC